MQLSKRFVVAVAAVVVLELEFGLYSKFSCDTEKTDQPSYPSTSRDDVASAEAFEAMIPVLHHLCMNCHSRRRFSATRDDRHRHPIDAGRGPSGDGFVCAKM